jgi:branched-chain amino acid transport system ATP-binding protein
MSVSLKLIWGDRPLLKVGKIDFYYGQVQVLYDVSIHVGEGEFVALVGANGAGKTTTMKTVSGLLHPRRGTIEFLGQPIHQREAHEITSLGLVHIPEGRKIFPSLTVKENLEMGSYLRAAKEKRVETMLKVFDLFPILDSRKNQIVGTLSGGEQQMLAIGRAMMALPKMLIIDEPSLGMAPLIVENIFNTIKSINRDGTTILFVEQNVFASLAMAQRGYVLENGQIVLEGVSQDLLANENVKKAYLGL